MPAYDPRDYWNKKARQFENDPVKAACAFNEYSNECIEKVQAQALGTVVESLGGRRAFQDQPLLDFGCGSGRWADYFVDLGCSYQGMDISDEMIEICRRYHPDLSFSVMNGAVIPAPPEAFHFVACIGVLHHNRREAQEALLDELARVVRPGGYLFLFEALGSKPLEREFPRTQSGWSDSVVARGFTSVAHRRYHCFPISHIASSIGRKFSKGYTNHWRIITWDAKLSPLLSRAVPGGTSGRAAMLFRRQI